MSDQTAAIHHMFDEQLDAFKSGVHKLVERATTKPTWLGRVLASTGETIKAHPIAAVGVALGLGYLLVRVTRQ
jgi:hypothetical protein